MGQVTENPENELIEGCRAGREAARRELYTRYAKQMLAVCYRYTGNSDAAHDVMHDGFMKVFTHFNFRGDCALSTWLTRVMSTTAIDYLRQQRRMAEWMVRDDTLPDLPDEDEAAEAAERIPNEVLMKMVAELPTGCRTVLNLYVFEGKSHKEIARMLGIHEHSSTSQLHRAKIILMKKIKQYLVS